MPGAPALTLRFPHDDPVIRELVAAEIDGTDATAIHDADDREWRVFYPTASSRASAETTLEPVCRAYGIAMVRIEVNDEDWARRSQAALTSVRIGAIIVAPPWDLSKGSGVRGQGSGATGPGPPAPGLPLTVIIEPSVGFGTGHHASTRLCLLALQRLDVRGRSVLDVGTGSGVLAIAAAKLGASRVTAIDTDADAVGNARENAARNGAAIDLRVGDVAELRLDPVDFVLANLTAAWLRRLAAPLLALAATAGTVVLSGLQSSERDRVLEVFTRAELLSCLEEEGWTALVLRKQR